ncbi:MAG: hypothetical protein ACRCUC_09520 [Aestuariivirga sp.]
MSLHTNPLTGQVNLPVDRWVLNEGVVVEAASFCPPASCEVPSAVFVLLANGEVVRRLKRELASDAALTKRRPPARTRLLGGGIRTERGKLTARTDISRSLRDGRELTQIVLSPRSGRGPVAHLAVLAQDTGQATRFAVAVSPDGPMALSRAESALSWR